MRDFIAALRAIWDSWQTGERLRFRGEHYRHVVMTPFFDPGPIDRPDIPVHLAAVGRGMARLVGEVADGIHLHPFHTARYVDEVVAPAIAAGASAAGRDPGDVEVVAPLFVVTGPDEASLDRAAAPVRSQIAFYASTPAYATVLEFHGWSVGDRLSGMARRGRWEEMVALVDDEMLRAIAVVATHDDLPGAIAARVGSRIDRFGLYPGDGLDPFGEVWLATMRAVSAS